MTRPYRPANGRFELDRGYNPDYIPAGPSWRPNLLPSLHVEVERRPCEVTSHFNRETGELLIFLQWAEPVKEGKKIDDLIAWAEGASLKKITIAISQETYSTTESLWYFKQRGFTRNEGREQAGFITLEKIVAPPDTPPSDLDKRAKRIQDAVGTQPSASVDPSPAPPIWLKRQHDAEIEALEADILRL